MGLHTAQAPKPQQPRRGNETWLGEGGAKKKKKDAALPEDEVKSEWFCSYRQREVNHLVRNRERHELVGHHRRRPVGVTGQLVLVLHGPRRRRRVAAELGAAVVVNLAEVLEVQQVLHGELVRKDGDTPVRRRRPSRGDLVGRRLARPEAAPQGKGGRHHALSLQLKPRTQKPAKRTKTVVSFQE